MHRKLLTALVSACALVVVMVGPATASAATLTLKNSLGGNAGLAHFSSPTITATTSLGSYKCYGLAISTSIIQNAANPVTLQQLNAPSVNNCQISGTSTTVALSNIQLTGLVTLNANGMGSLPIQATETWTPVVGAPTSCTRQGTLGLMYDIGQSSPSILYHATLTKTAGPAGCPNTTQWSGTFAAPKGENGATLTWVVTG